MSSTLRAGASNCSEGLRGDLRYYLKQYWKDSCDQRAAGLPFIGDGPWALIAMLMLYLIFVLKVGPKMMKNRKPYELRGPMFAYNAMMVVINFYFFLEALQWLDNGRQLANFQWPDGNDRSERTMAHIWSFYFYWLTKFLDLFDTVFFVLRKKYSQISTLHIYHHSIVPILGWLHLWNRFGAPGVNLFALLNSAVHVVMYSYYGLTAFGPRIQKYLWWKRYITQIQLIQFGLLCVYTYFVYNYQQNYPSNAFYICTTQPPIFIFMFTQFYLKSYSGNKGMKKID